MDRAFVFNVGKLTSGRYSVPKGSLCIGEPCEHIENAYHCYWLPPQSGSSVPVDGCDLENAGTMAIPEHMLYPEGRQLGWVESAQKEGNWVEEFEDRRDAIKFSGVD